MKPKKKTEEQGVSPPRHCGIAGTMADMADNTMQWKITDGEWWKGPKNTMLQNYDGAIMII